MRNDLITVLDVGTTKICCFVARKNADSRSGARVVGIGHHAANGLRGGVIVDMDVAAESIASAVHTAEKMAEDKAVWEQLALDSEKEAEKYAQKNWKKWYSKFKKEGLI